jgi:hypothetical protein
VTGSARSNIDKIEGARSHGRRDENELDALAMLARCWCTELSRIESATVRGGVSFDLQACVLRARASCANVGGLGAGRGVRSRTQDGRAGLGADVVVAKLTSTLRERPRPSARAQAVDRQPSFPRS